MAAPRPDQIVVLTDFSAIRGGASQIAMLQARLMHERGLKVTVFSGDGGSEIPDGMEPVPLGESRLLERSRLHALTRGLWNPAARRRLARWIAVNDRPGTIYHLHGWHQILSPAVLAALLPVAKRVAIHAHDYFLACPNGGFFDFRTGATCDAAPMSAACIGRNCDKRSYPQKLWRVTRQAVQNRVSARLMRQATTVLLHPAMERWLSHPAPQRLAVLPNPVEATPRAGLKPQTQRDFLYLGDIHLYKGVFLLAEAARRAGVAVRFVGSGADLERLAERYPEHQFTGWVERAEIAAHMAAARALVAPSLGPEPWGLAPVEALGAGLPVVLSDSMLLSESLARRKACASFRSGDCEALGALLSRLASDDRLIARMAADAPAAAREVSLTPAAWGDRLIALYETMLGQARDAAPAPGNAHTRTPAPQAEDAGQPGRTGQPGRKRIAQECKQAMPPV